MTQQSYYTPTAAMTITTERYGWFQWYSFAVIPSLDRIVRMGPYWHEDKARRMMRLALLTNGIT